MILRLPAPVVAVTAALALPASADAHVTIESYSPRTSAPTTLEHVRVSFSGRIASAQLTVRKGTAKVSRGAAVLNGRKTRVRVRLSPDLTAGRYVARLKYLNADGHVLNKTWSFRLR